MPSAWLTWIDPENRDQLAWIGRYLSDKGYPDFIRANGDPLEGTSLINGMAQHEQDRAFRYCADKMRAAWRQKQYRTRNGQQVAFQLPKRVQADLARLAKMEGRTKVETLRQLISNAAEQRDRDREEVKSIKEKRKQEKALYLRLLDNMLEELAKELHERFRLEEDTGYGENLTLDIVKENKKRIRARVEERIKAFENQIPELNTLHLPRGNLRKRLTPDSAPKA